MTTTITKNVTMAFTFPDNRLPDVDSNWTQKMFVADGHVVIQLFWADKPYPTYQREIPLAEWHRSMKAIGAAKK